MRKLAVALTAVAVLLAGGCRTGGDDPATGAGQFTRPIVIGLVGARSGAFAVHDTEQIAGMRRAIEEINAVGGIDGRPVELITADHGSDPTRVGAAARDVLNRGADVVVTSADSELGAPAALAARRENKVSVGGSDAPQFALRGLGPLHFNLYQGGPTESVVLAQTAYGQRARKPYLLVEADNPAATALCAEFETAWERLAGEGSVAGRGTFTDLRRSLAGQVDRIRAADRADALVLCADPGAGVDAIRQVRAARVKLPVYTGSGVDGVSWSTVLPGLTNIYHPALVATADDDPRPGVADLLATVPFTGSARYALYGYLAVQTVARGVAQAGTATGPELARALESFQDEPLLVGPTSYSAVCHAPIGRPLTVLRVVGGRAVHFRTVPPADVPPTAC
ncbi:ABC transporter substrate-binding protein [Micromonospora cathayae]|uniref:ABC transporter substrate-binding protein n=1 Tax=Micromonospora cathayae TaxID=3028804 RepID=A0ABY7ZK13_9ACTN|nr:ABC transporter substrate-binding protein [Micromonospora sp. HUAS 3]WDZ83301.1 ABC transporter substrate-binding protein [Micromonospora sp. HUAS 3]